MAALSSTSYLHSLVGNERHFFSCKTSQFSKPLSISPSLNKPRFSVPFCTKQSDRDQKLTKQESKKNEEKEDYWVVIAIRSKYNEIVIVDTVDARYLLDSTKKTHSAINKGGENWTDSYWDEFASLPPIVPDGPIAIYGLGGGTAARLILELYPSTQLEGWEIDDILIEKAREYMELSELEKLTSKGGSLRVLIDDALSLSEDVSGKYAGIIVDLFADGKDLDQLQQILQMVMFTLVKLTLGSHIDLGNIPSGVSLPALKSLFINTIFFTYGDLCNVLLPGCPVLEELSVRHVNCERIPFCISNRSIKKLSVYYNFETVITDMPGPIEEDAGLRDLIIWLPEEVLGSILSLLPTKQAASTSVLAKKWRHV
ncbi:PREDICTED: uncharacterized protein LOC106308904 [Brassica oleracea var. oleracea]|uniref:uncharacterized protein LOC106308904 n=1 Tax=Brassica oleracea var. oleracea TaxID=109376 RepID=UPI0006A6EFB9|nr:PREDICTED: uncharacterized protein LOC106308904 [Brassica oleracea var. oleracea]